jgi:hypothetical protein
MTIIEGRKKCKSHPRRNWTKRERRKFSGLRFNRKEKHFGASASLSFVIEWKQTHRCCLAPCIHSWWGGGGRKLREEYLKFRRRDQSIWACMKRFAFNAPTRSPPFLLFFCSGSLFLLLLAGGGGDWYSFYLLNHPPVSWLNETKGKEKRENSADLLENKMMIQLVASS